jgi:hypothetical protein
VSSITLDDTRPLLPRRPRRGSVLAGHPRAADDGGPHRKIAPRTPQGREGPSPQFGARPIPSLHAERGKGWGLEVTGC